MVGPFCVVPMCSPAPELLRSRDRIETSVPPLLLYCD